MGMERRKMGRPWGEAGGKSLEKTQESDRDQRLQA